jgi:predicted nuclease with TOPRIM domain
MRPKPKLLLDIKPGARVDVFHSRQRRLNLSRSGAKQLPRRLFSLFIVLLIGGTIFFVGGSARAPVGSGTYAVTTQEERAALEAQLKELEGQIEEYQKTINEYRKQGKTLQGEINLLEAQIKKINTQIRAINLALARLDSDIQVTSGKINKVQQDIDLNEEALAALIRQVDAYDRKGLLEIMLENPNLSDFFGSLNDILVVQDNLRATTEKLADLKSQLITQRELLGMERSDVETLKAYQLQQKQQVDALRGEKTRLLQVTKGKESEYQKLLTQTKQTAAQIRNRIFELLGGGQLTFEQAYQFAKFAEQATGVRAALILAVLDRESALGRNVGRCSYKTAMHPDRDIPYFLQITAELGLNPENTLVSCPNADGLYGGAMGPAQFIPSTWMLYRNKVASITGNNPPSPWRNTDAFVAAALYLRDLGAKSSELTAAARYYCGSNWQRYVCTQIYGQNVVNRANDFADDIRVLQQGA